MRGMSRGRVTVVFNYKNCSCVLTERDPGMLFTLVSMSKMLQFLRFLKLAQREEVELGMVTLEEGRSHVTVTETIHEERQAGRDR